MRDVLIVLCTCPDRDEATKLAHAAVERGLAACVNIIPGIESLYRWQGRVEAATEFLLLAKTTRERFEQLCSYLEGAHSYDVPEIIAIPVGDGSIPYLDWVAESVRLVRQES